MCVCGGGGVSQSVERAILSGGRGFDPGSGRPLSSVWISVSIM